MSDNQKICDKYVQAPTYAYNTELNRSTNTTRFSVVLSKWSPSLPTTVPEQKRTLTDIAACRHLYWDSLHYLVWALNKRYAKTSVHGTKFIQDSLTKMSGRFRHSKLDSSSMYISRHAQMSYLRAITAQMRPI